MLPAPQMVPEPPAASDATSMVSLPVKTRNPATSRVAMQTPSKYSKSRLESLIPWTAPSVASAARVAGSMLTFVN